jgi:hypothetical protein
MQGMRLRNEELLPRRICTVPLFRSTESLFTAVQYVNRPYNHILSPLFKHSFINWWMWWTNEPLKLNWSLGDVLVHSHSHFTAVVPDPHTGCSINRSQCTSEPQQTGPLTQREGGDPSATVRWYILWLDRFCGLVVRVPGYRSRCTGSIPGATRFSEK